MALLLTLIPSSHSLVTAASPVYSVVLLLHWIYAMALLSCPYILKTINSIWNHHNIYFTVVSYNIPTHIHARAYTHTHWLLLIAYIPFLLSFSCALIPQFSHVSFVFDTEVVWYYILLNIACMYVSLCVCVAAVAVVVVIACIHKSIFIVYHYKKYEYTH